MYFVLINKNVVSKKYIGNFSDLFVEKNIILNVFQTLLVIEISGVSLFSFMISSLRKAVSTQEADRAREVRV